ncbi:MAG: TIGR03067 domain-containing protein [Isosphaeraceae bacterium]
MFLVNLVCGLGLVVLLNSLSIAQEADATSDAKADKVCTPEALVGRYVIVSGEKDGVKEPEERIKGTVVTFSKEKVVVADKEKKELYSATYKLDSTKNPSDIIMTSNVASSSGEIARGLIRKEGDTVRLIYALPTGEIPTGFKTKQKQLMFVMKKAE